MSPKLNDHLQYSLSHNQLLDPSIRKAPAASNPWAVYCAWAFDWIVAIVCAQLAINAWMSFIGPLGFNSLPAGTRQVITQHSQALRLVLAPLAYFAISYVGVTFHGMTPGLRIFKHTVKAPHAKEAALWAFGATVSSAILGLPLLNNWLDQFAGTETHSQRFAYWHFTKAQHETVHVPWSMLEAVQSDTHHEEVEEYSKAA